MKNLKNFVLKCVIYIRVSTAPQADPIKNSLENQLKRCLEQINIHGWVDTKIVFEEVDTGESMEPRDQVNKLISQSGDDTFNLVVVYDYDRLARDSTDSQVICKLLLMKGVQVYSVNQRTEPDDPANIDYYSDTRLLTEMISAIKSRMEINSTRRRYQQGMENKVRRGELPHPKKPPYGYRSKQVEDPVGSGKYRWDVKAFEPEAEVVRRIVNSYLAHKSLRKIARELSNENIPTPRGKRWWHYATVRVILENPAYARLTRWRFKKVKHPNAKSQVKRPANECLILEANHESIIPRSKYELVRKLLAEKRTLPGRFSQGKALLSGLIRCEKCGKKMYALSATKNAPAYYACATWHQFRQCEANYVNMIEADDAVLKVIFNAVKNEQEFIAAYTRSLENKGVADPVSLLLAKKESLEEQKKRIQLAYASNKMTMTDMSKLCKPIEKEIKEVQKRIDDTKEQQARRRTAEEVVQKIRDMRDIHIHASTNKTLMRSNLILLLNDVKATRISRGEYSLAVDYKKF